MNESKSTAGGSRRPAPGAPAVAWRALGLVTLAALTLGTAAWLEIRVWRDSGRLVQQAGELRPLAFLAGEQCLRSIEVLDASLLRFQLSDEPIERDRFNQEARALSELIARVKGQAQTASESQHLSRLESELQQYLAKTTPLLQKGLRAIRRDSAATTHAFIQAASEPLRSHGAALAGYQAQRLDGAVTQWADELARLRNQVELSAALWIPLIGLVGLLTYRATIGPLRYKLSESQSVIDRQQKLASLGVLATGVAHEIRNPLTAIKFRVFSLRKSLGLVGESNEDLQVIQAEINRLERIVKDFLQFARPSEPELVSLPLGRVLTEVQSLLAAQWQKQGIELRLESPDAVWVRADKQQLQQVLINLIQNAAESMDSGTITLRAKTAVATLSRRSTPVALVEIADTGRGIPREVEHRIFDPFFSTKEGGTGLGLAIAARIVEKHGGFLQYVSRKDHGTTFTVVLPRMTDDARSDSAH